MEWFVEFVGSLSVVGTGIFAIFAALVSVLLVEFILALPKLIAEIPHMFSQIPTEIESVLQTLIAKANHADDEYFDSEWMDEEKFKML